MRPFTLTLLATAILGAFSEPELVITAHFPEENPFHHVINGEKNSLYLIVENKSELNSSLKSLAGSFHHPETGALVKNITTMNLPVLAIAGSRSSIPFSFHSESPGDYNLRVWVDHTIDQNIYRVFAYDGVVTVVEPESSLFDFKMLTTYLITALVLSGVGYYAALSFFPSLSKPKRKRTVKPSEAEITAPIGTVKASGVGYQEEWIPEHHLKPVRKGKKGDGVLSSGDEKATSGAESGTEGPRRSKRGKKA
ncbi:hypothetical protein M422DRAFT_58680 [Sphaerobolus stellatus SS14]|nr:hypothetical protein M422DRAFT_58680 [Sphaerobolus stellatus SS14]